MNDYREEDKSGDLFSVIEKEQAVPEFFKKRDDDLKIEELKGEKKKELLQIMKDEVNRLSFILKNLK